MTKTEAERLFALAARALPSDPRLVVDASSPKNVKFDVEAILTYRIQGLIALSDALRMLQRAMAVFNKIKDGGDLPIEVIFNRDETIEEEIEALLREWEQ